LRERLALSVVPLQRLQLTEATPFMCFDAKQMIIPQAKLRLETVAP
jgi:hypothetical protein